MPGAEALRPHHPAWKERTPRDLGAGWDFEDVRDHYLEQLFRVDARALRSTDCERYLDLSRMLTGELMHAAFSEWRRPQSSCAGALVLMLRDFWPGAGWGVMDDEGNPKPCWHALRRALQPVTVLLTDEGLNGLCAHVVNETAHAQRLHIELQAWHAGDVSVAKAEQGIEVPARGTLSIPAAAMLDHFMDLSWSYRFGAPPCDVVLCSLRNGQGVRIARAHHFCDGYALPIEQDVGLRAQMKRIDAHAVQVHVTTQRFACGVHFDFSGMVAHDDFFHLAPGDEATVLLRSRTSAPARGEIRAINSLHAASLTQEPP
jgi:beta-mannosidase